MDWCGHPLNPEPRRFLGAGISMQGSETSNGPSLTARFRCTVRISTEIQVLTNMFCNMELSLLSKGANVPALTRAAKGVRYGL